MRQRSEHIPPVTEVYVALLTGGLRATALHPSFLLHLETNHSWKQTWLSLQAALS